MVDKLKILICGKGGCGKSTISALLAKEFAKRENNVLVIDSDESNYGLHTQLGMKLPSDFMNYFGGKKLLFEKTKELKKNWKINDLPEDYLSKKGNIKFLIMGKINNFGEGCGCPINILSSKFLEVLKLESNEFLIVDTDAGIEHFGRGVEKGCDLLLMVIDPTRESIMLSKKISKLAKQVNKPLYYILNKVNNEIEKELIKSLDKNKIAAIVKENKEIFNFGFRGKELNIDLESIKNLIDFLENENMGVRNESLI